MAHTIQCDYSALSTSITHTEIGSCNFSSVGDLSDREMTTDDESTDTMETHLIYYDRSPPDRFNVVFLTFILLGLGTLLPWNFFITADDYWMYKFRNCTQDIDHISHMKYIYHDKTTLQVAFTSYLAIANNGPLIIMLVISSFFGHKASPKFRLGLSLMVMLILFVLVTAFVQIRTDEMQMTFFAVTMISVIFISAAGAVFQAGVAGLASVLPSRYIHAMVAGQAISGIFAAVTHIFSLLGHMKPTTSALTYFICADVTLLLTLTSYLFISRTDFLKFYLQLSEDAKENKTTPTHYVSSSSIKEIIYGDCSSYANRVVPLQSETEYSIVTNHEDSCEVKTSNSNFYSKINVLCILKKVWPQAFSVLLTFWVTLSVYPAVTVLVSSQNHASDSLWTGTLFIPINCFLLFNVGDLCGRLVGSWVPLLPSHSKWLLGFSFCRIALVPLFMLCNVQPRLNLPVIFHNDVYYISFTTVLGITNGYVATVGMAQAAEIISKALQEQTGNIMSTFMGGGLILGSVTSYGVLKLL